MDTTLHPINPLRSDELISCAIQCLLIFSSFFFPCSPLTRTHTPSAHVVRLPHGFRRDDRLSAPNETASQPANLPSQWVGIGGEDGWGGVLKETKRVHHRQFSARMKKRRRDPAQLNPAAFFPLTRPLFSLFSSLFLVLPFCALSLLSRPRRITVCPTGS